MDDDDDSPPILLGNTAAMSPFDRECDRYKSSITEKEEDALIFWRGYDKPFAEGGLPILARCARHFLALQVTSVESERFFSLAGLV